MGRFDRYLLSQLMVLFGFFALVLILVYWVNRAVSLFDQLVADGQTMGIFLTLSLLTLPGLIAIVLPLAAFAASLYVTNRMTAESELIVLQATGSSAYRLGRPVVIFGLIVAGLMSVLTHYLVPAAASEMNRRQAEIAQNATARFLQEGQFLSPTSGITLYIREITQAGELRDIFLSDTRARDESVIYTASSAYVVRTITGPQLVMIDGMAQALQRQSQRLITTSFKDLAYDIGTLVNLPDTTRRSSRELSTPELLSPTPDLIEETRRTAGQLVAEGHNRFAQAILGFVGPLIGFATLLIGGFSRFGVWRQVLAAIALVIVVKMIETITTNAVRVNPANWPLTYLAGLTGVAMALVLMWSTTRPAMFQRRPRGARA
ncbi:MAG: LPS export ABC transporter permease LptF [Flavimaricola sp.]|nr:LPS export ABC transporter permease LptF [Flavimaricola sp.]